jgi:pseudoazurin
MEVSMTKLITRRTALFTASAAAATLMAAPRIALAANSFDVQMLTKHPENKKLRNVFFPRIQVVEPGDTVNFVATDKTHNSASAKGMLPEGAETWKGKINKDISVTFDKPGFYGYVCTPHTSLGMVGLIIVKGDGMMDNMEAAKAVKQKGKARKAWKEIWEEVDKLDLGA